MEWWSGFANQLLHTSWLEAVAVVTGIGSVWYSKQENILVYPVGIISVLIYVYLAWEYKLYADSAVNFYYFIMSVYGWYNWKHTNVQADQIPITKNNMRGNALNVSIFLIVFLLMSLALIKFTDSDVPIWDALTTSAALTAMWLMARKKIEHWLFWILCNLISIPLYASKGLLFTSFQFVVFTIIATLGWVSWRKKLLRTPD